MFQIIMERNKERLNHIKAFLKNVNDIDTLKMIPLCTHTIERNFGILKILFEKQPT